LHRIKAFVRQYMLQITFRSSNTSLSFPIKVSIFIFKKHSRDHQRAFQQRGVSSDFHTLVFYKDSWGPWIIKISKRMYVYHELISISFLIASWTNSSNLNWRQLNPNVLPPCDHYEIPQSLSNHNTPLPDAPCNKSNH